MLCVPDLEQWHILHLRSGAWGMECKPCYEFHTFKNCNRVVNQVDIHVRRTPLLGHADMSRWQPPCSCGTTGTTGRAMWRSLGHNVITRSSSTGGIVELYGVRGGRGRFRKAQGVSSHAWFRMPLLGARNFQAPSIQFFQWAPETKI